MNNIDERRIRTLTGEEIYILDMMLNYEKVNSELIERYALLFFDDYDPAGNEFEKRSALTLAETNIKEVIDNKLIPKSFDFILEGQFYLGEYDFNTGSFPVYRKGTRVIPKHMLVGKTEDNYAYYFTTISTHPDMLAIPMSEEQAFKLYSKMVKDSNSAREVSITLHIAPEYFTFAPQRGYMPVRVLQADIWYQGQVIGSHIISEKEERVTTFSVNGVTITTKWTIENGVPKGLIKSYYPNDMVYCQGYYFEPRSTAKEGKFEFFDINGRFIKEENYKEGLSHGPSYEIYHGASGISSIAFKYFDNGLLTCHESLNIIGSEVRRMPVKDRCQDVVIDSVLKTLKISAAFPKSSTVKPAESKPEVTKPVVSTSPLISNGVKPENIANRFMAMLVNKSSNGCFAPNFAIDTIKVLSSIAKDQMPFVEEFKRQLGNTFYELSAYHNVEPGAWNVISDDYKYLITIRMVDFKLMTYFDYKASPEEKKKFHAFAVLEVKVWHYKTNNEILMKVIKSNEGNPVEGKTQLIALEKLVNVLAAQIKSAVLEHNTMIGEVMDIREMNADFTPRILTLNNAELVSPDPNLFYYIAERSDIHFGEEAVEVKKVLGVVKFGTKTGTTVFVSVVQGGLSIKDALEKGKQLAAVSVYKPDLVNSSISMQCFEGE